MIIPRRFISCDDFFAELGQAAQLGDGVARGVGPVRPAPVGERHQPDAGAVESVEQAQIVFDGVAAFDTDENAASSRYFGFSGIPSGALMTSRSSGLCRDQAIDGFDLVESFLGGLSLFGLVRRSRDIAGEDFEVDRPAFQLGDIDVAFGQVFRKSSPAMKRPIVSQCRSMTAASLWISSTLRSSWSMSPVATKLHPETEYAQDLYFLSGFVNKFRG